MGFRTVMMTADCSLEVPMWFIEKWNKKFNIPVRTYGGVPKGSTPITSKWERKFGNSKDEEIFHDLQKVLLEQTDRGLDLSFEVVLFHECNGVTKVHIGKNFIKMYEPSDWYEVDKITHYYCYGCSTPAQSESTK